MLAPPYGEPAGGPGRWRQAHLQPINGTIRKEGSVSEQTTGFVAVAVLCLLIATPRHHTATMAPTNGPIIIHQPPLPRCPPGDAPLPRHYACIENL
jgi:hypothetical protein